MWIVRVALTRPYTFIVAALVIVLMTPIVLLRTPTDVFPNIDIPVVSVCWNYSGLSPQLMQDRIVSPYSRFMTTVVDNIEHTESQIVAGRAIIKVFFQPGADVHVAVTQISALSETMIRQLPPGISAPLIITYSASSVPVLQLGMRGEGLSEQELFDFGANLVRNQLANVAGAAIPWPYGGKQRQVSVNLDIPALQAKGLSPTDVINAISTQNLVLPSGTVKMGSTEFNVEMNGSPDTLAALNNLPIRTVNGATIYVRDVAYVSDGFSPQVNIARMDGQRGVILAIYKNGDTSTLDVVSQIYAKLPQIKSLVPPQTVITPLFDQSIFVRAAIAGVVREAVIAAALTALMILLFLGSWRSTVIIAISIPLSILASIICLSALGETINIMTLGGLALAVGILVDDATVTVENINWHLEHGEDVEAAILNGAHEIAVPALVSTLAICIVFVPMFMLAGIARFLFVPLAEAVVFAMLASYALSRTLVPTLAKYWLQRHDAHAAPPRGLLARCQQAFEKWFVDVRARYEQLLGQALDAGMRFAAPFLTAMAATALLAFPFGRYLPGLGQDFFPSVDAGQIKLHIRAPTGIRIDETAALCDRIEASIREIIPAKEIATIVDNVGVPYSGINLSYSTSAPVGPGDADIFVNLTPEHHATADYVRSLRRALPQVYPSTMFAFLSADIVSQILNFGLPAPLDVQVSGFDVDANRTYAQSLLGKMRAIPGAVDLRIQQAFDYPQIRVDVDRSKAALLGLSERDVASDPLVSLSGSFQTSPSFWIDPKTGTQYNVTTQTPQFRLNSLQDLATTPVTGAGSSQLLANLASFSRAVAPAVVSHYDSIPVIDIYGSVQGADLGFIAAQINKLVAETRHDLPRGSQVIVRGQVKTMTDSFTGLLIGLAGAVVLVYLLIVVNFQSWRDPFIIITALPAALAGIVWMLFLTHTSVSVPALTGAIMCMGVATANSVLVISFARERMLAGDDARHAAITAGVTRFRPVLMTALAMIIGMLPMALGLGEGGEQNAPLGRAVIGGLLFATVATLFFVPTIFTLVHGRRSAA